MTAYVPYNSLSMENPERRVLRLAAWVATVLALLAISIGTLSLYRLGGAVTWRQWLGDYAFYFLFWRTGLYIAVVCGGWWIKRAHVSHPLLPPMARAAGALAVLIELSLWANQL